MTPRKLERLGPVIARVVVRRANGRYVTDLPVRSKYQQKQAIDKLGKKYDSSFYLEVE